MPWKKTKNASYVGRWYSVMSSLQGQEVFSAYHDLFPEMPEDPKAHYEILNEESNKNLIVALYKSKTPNIEQLTETTGLEPDDISERLEFFKENGMKKIKISKVA